MRADGVSFSIANQVAWAPGIDTAEGWAAWAKSPFPIADGADPAVKAMPPMLRRRAGFLGKMALEVAYRCLDGRSAVPAVFCSRHGDVSRSVELLADLVRGDALSPTAFGMAVHNATAGLFSIARADRANHLALAAGSATIEHAVIEACGLLADGAPMVLLVASECPVPEPFVAFRDCDEQAHAWAWLMVPAVPAIPSTPAGQGGAGPIHLRWQAIAEQAADSADSADTADAADEVAATMPSAGLDILRFALSGAAHLERLAGRRRWHWSRAASDDVRSC